MYIVFLADQQGYLPIQKKIPIATAEKMLSDLNSGLVQQQDQEASISFQLCTDKGECVYQSVFVLPRENFTLLSCIEEELRKDPAPEAIQFIDWLKEEWKKAPNPDKAKKEKKKSILSEVKQSARMLFLIPLLALAVAVFLLVSRMNNQVRYIQQLQEHFQVIDQLESEKKQVDTFSRYFLSSYFSSEENAEKYQEGLKKYVFQEVVAESKPNDQQLTSVLLWESQKQEDRYQVSYVVSVKEKEKSTVYKINLVLAEEENGQYKVAEKPVMDAFDIQLHFKEENSK